MQVQQRSYDKGDFIRTPIGDIAAVVTTVWDDKGEIVDFIYATGERAGQAGHLRVNMVEGISNKDRKRAREFLKAGGAKAVLTEEAA